MMSQPISMETIDSHGCGLAVEFTWQNDRYGHEVFLIEGARRTVLLTSVEGLPTEFWPASPPMQQLSLEDIKGQSAVLGVGMAGISHWSVSFLMDAGPLPRLVCEMACFAKDQPERIGSQYKSENDIRAVRKNAVRVARLVESKREVLFLANGANADTLITEKNRMTVAADCAEQTPTTIQWKYEISLTDLKNT